MLSKGMQSTCKQSDKAYCACTWRKASRDGVQQCCRHGRTTSGSLLMYSKGTAGTIWALGMRVARRPPIDACNLRIA